MAAVMPVERLRMKHRKKNKKFRREDERKKKEENGEELRNNHTHTYTTTYVLRMQLHLERKTVRTRVWQVRSSRSRSFLRMLLMKPLCC